MRTLVNCLLLIGLVVLIPGGAVFGFDRDTDPNLIGCWKLDDGAGTVAVDSSGKHHDGTLMSSGTTLPAWTDGFIGTALSLNPSGASGTGYVNCGNHPDFDLTSQVTLAAWIYPARLTSSGHESYITKGDYTYTLKEANTNGNIEMNIYNGTWYTATITGMPSSSNNTWIHLAGTFDGSIIKLYRNGVQGATRDYAGTIGTSTYPVVLGAQATSATAVQRGYRGRIDEARIYSRALTEAEIVTLMSNPFANRPTPANKATDLNRDGQVLGWTPGQGAVKHNVYFGTDPNALVMVGPAQEPNTLTLGRLELGGKYYWRVDEVAADGSTTQGYLWQFDVEPDAYPIVYRAATATVPANILVTASARTTADPNVTVTGAGLTGDLHGIETAGMWNSGVTAQPVWIQYNFDRVYKLSRMLVWNYNADTELDLGFGIKDATVQYSADGVTFSDLGDFEFAQGTALEDYQYNTIVDFGGVPVKAVKILAKSTFGGAKYGLSEVRFLRIRAEATVPSPATAATGIRPDATLSWRSGRDAAQHKVYLGTDPNALALADTVSSASYTPTTIQLGATHYWKVEEVNAADGGYPWPSEVWSFTTPTYLTVDNMESYNDMDGTAIFNAWADGYNSGTNGSQVGNDQTPYAEVVFAHGGAQAMPFYYTNTAGEPTSEATRTFTPAQDWTMGGITTLVLFVRPEATNSGGQLYVKINNVKVDYPSTLVTSPAPLWTQWNVDLTNVSGLKAVNTLTIGISGLGTGKLYVDDIRLYRAPADVTPKDPGTANLLSYFNMEGGKVVDNIAGITGTLNGATFVDSLGAYGQALKCTGGSTAETTQYVDLGAAYWDKVVSKLSSCTISVWVNYLGAGTDGEGAVWSRVFDFGAGSNVNVFLTTSAGTAGIARFVVKTNVPVVGSTSTNYTETLSSSPKALQAGWHHLVGVVDATGAPVQYLYVDGAVASGPNVSRLPKDMAPQTTPWQMWIGRSQYTADPYLRATVDDLRVYDRALTAGEIYWLAGGR